MSSPKGDDIFNMASKGQKFKKYTKEFKETVLEEYHKGYSSKYLSLKYGVPKGTVDTWKHQIRYPKTGRRGRPKNEGIDYKERYEILKKYLAFLKGQQKRK